MVVAGLDQTKSARSYSNQTLISTSDALLLVEMMAIESVFVGGIEHVAAVFVEQLQPFARLSENARHIDVTDGRVRVG